jgi:hypothetical protein
MSIFVEISVYIDNELDVFYKKDIKLYSINFYYCNVRIYLKINSINTTNILFIIYNILTNII